MVSSPLLGMDAARDWRPCTTGISAKISSAVQPMVHSRKKRLGLHNFARNTYKMTSKTKQEKKAYVRKAMTIIVLLGATTSMTKSALFHMNAVGTWDHGQPYKFSYALSLTLMVFLLKMCLGLVEIFFRGDETDEDKAAGVAMCKATPTDADGRTHAEPSLTDWLMPWVLLVTFTVFEMLSSTIASVGLLCGTPTSVFVVFKSSKVVFLAIMSVLVLGRSLNAAQWSALLLISLSMMVATLAEGKGTRKGGGVSFLGPALLLLSELFHATFLVLQEISVRRYWSSPLALLCASAALGCVMTLTTMHAAAQVWMPLPDGGHRPMSDFVDSVYMCFQNKVLGCTMLLHLLAHVSSDVMHIVILQHISALARTLCDAVKLIIMWFCGKAFWLCGIFPFLAEAWHPGLIGSGLMLPTIVVVVYSLLMFKHKSFMPLRLVQIETEGALGRKWGLEERKDKRPVEDVKVLPEDPFYVPMFRSKKIRQEIFTESAVDPCRMVRSRIPTPAGDHRGGCLSR